MNVNDRMTAAQDQARAAAAELAEAERTLPLGGVDDATAARLAVLHARVRQAERVVVQLREQQAEQARALDARDARERVAAPALADAQRRLEASAAALVALVGAAEAALLAAVGAARAHDALVSRVRDELAAAGLSMSDVDGTVDHATGAVERVSHAAPAGLRLRGHAWAPLDASALLYRAAWRVHRAVFGVRHIGTARLAFMPGVAELDRRCAALLAALPDLPAVPEPAVPTLPPRPEREATGSAPSPSARVDLDRTVRPQPDPRWADEFRGRYGIDPEGPEAA